MKSDLIRIGQISSINYKNGTAKVVYPELDDAVTDDLPFLSFEYMMPAIGDQVLVVHKAGAMHEGVIVGQIFENDNLPDLYGSGQYQKKLDSVTEVSSKAGALVIDAKSIQFKTDSGNITMADIISHIRG